MKREILFRGFHPDENGKTIITIDGNKIKGEWVEGDLIQSQDTNIAFIHPKTNTFTIKKEVFACALFLSVLPETVCQFTELTTAGGQKIFENDICEYAGELYVVKQECDIASGYWAETGFMLDHIGYSDYMCFTDTIDEFSNEIAVEVIGNIYEKENGV